MLSCVGDCGNWLGGITPRFIATFTFLPCGLLMGYSMAAFSIDRDHLNDFLYYGPLILGCLIALIMASVYVATKFWRNKILFFHFEVFIATGCINIIASILFFIDNLDIYGSYIAFIAYGMTFISALTYLNIISSKNNRTIILSICFVWYLFGIASAISLIGVNVKLEDNRNNITTTTTTIKSIINNVEKFDFNFDNITNNFENITNINENITNFNENITNMIESNYDLKYEKYIDNRIRLTSNINTDGIYQGMAGLYLTTSILIVIILSIIKIYNYLGNLDYKKSLDYDIFIANSNETIFDTRSEVIKQTNFFYVTKSKQWLVSFILLFCDSIHFSFFVYILSWFIFNPAISLTHNFNNYGLIYWIVFFGSIVGVILLFFISIKMIFVISTLSQILLLILGMIIRNESLIPLWIVCFLYGMNFSNIKVLVLETAHLKFSELMIFISCTTKLCSIGVINVSFMRDINNSIFYREDSATLIAHCLAFITISSLITIIVTIKVPRTYKNSLFDIQNCLLGIIFKKHQIEQLNMKYLSDGTIPTISRNVDTPSST
ncbi:uncharacterized protein LOC129613248 [Condylostylus longicornis]|uniref:uncharacterized protein LOC129613248 n=1 Tax=Condylostylus longicornis TaxID=2530218 RepID=UPI00244E13F7|nr:uncharacterized protein LOC129613248 [Condylostylus longicornis]